MTYATVLHLQSIVLMLFADRPQEAELRLYGVAEANSRFRAFAQTSVDRQAAQGRNAKPMQLYLAAAQRSHALTT